MKLVIHQHMDHRIDRGLRLHQKLPEFRRGLRVHGKRGAACSRGGFDIGILREVEVQSPAGGLVELH